MKKIILIVLTIMTVSCNKDKKEEKGKDGFNRKQMLTFWADKIITPGYEDYTAKTADLDLKVIAFTDNPTDVNLVLARKSWENAYISWQKISLFQLGKAKGLALAKSTNLFPTLAQEIEGHISSGKYDLTLSNYYAKQGFPALDYLLYGVAADNAAIVQKYTNDNKLKKYTKDVSKRLNSLAVKVKEDWAASYRNTFVSKDGNSETDSTNDVINYFVIRFYEEQLRDYKIGIPSGAKKDHDLNSNEVEAVYRNDLSKKLFQTALQSAYDFFNGVSYEGSSNGESLKQYLAYLKRDDIATVINKRLKESKEISDSLDNSFQIQIENETKRRDINDLFDALDKNVISFKTDMMSAMNIGVTISQPADND